METAKSLLKGTAKFYKKSYNASPCDANANMVNASLPPPAIISFLTAFISPSSTKPKRFATTLARLVKPRAMSRAGALRPCSWMICCASF
jgi:hypothetical protein